MYRIGSYQYMFRPYHAPGEPRRLDTWSECTADVQSARLGLDGVLYPENTVEVGREFLYLDGISATWHDVQSKDR